eukprot:3889952-Pleurochrysis_carterae.AAC.1
MARTGGWGQLQGSRCQSDTPAHAAAPPPSGYVTSSVVPRNAEPAREQKRAAKAHASAKRAEPHMAHNAPVRCFRSARQLLRRPTGHQSHYLLPNPVSASSCAVHDITRCWSLIRPLVRHEQGIKAGVHSSLQHHASSHNLMPLPRLSYPIPTRPRVFRLRGADGREHACIHAQIVACIYAQI